jgi:hypothetical protein
MTEALGKIVENLDKPKETSGRTELPIDFLRPHDPNSILPWEKSIPLRQSNEVMDKYFLIKNKEDGLRRERDVEAELKKEYPEEEGYAIESEVYLRDKDGNIVRDPVTGEARRIDFVVIKDGKVVKPVEVTSQTASKDEQIAKESRIRESGGNYILDSNGNLVEISPDTKTEIARRD